MRTSLLAVLAALPLLGTTSLAQGFGADVDETAGGGMEEAAALYFAKPDTEDADAAIDQTRLGDMGTVQLAIALGQVEDGLSACQTLRREMQSLIGDTYGSYSVNPGWLRRYQDCVLTRAEEVRAVGRAIRARQTDLIARIGEEEEDEEAAADAMRAADLMARLSARQSDVKLAISREGRMQRAFVRYYNTGEMPDALREETPRPQVRVPAGERPLERPAPATDTLREAPDAAADFAPPSLEPVSAPGVTPPAAATGAPTPLHDPGAEPSPGSDL